MPLMLDAASKLVTMGVLSICFGQFGPYHHARVAALQRLAGEIGDGGAAENCKPSLRDRPAVQGQLILNTADCRHVWHVLPVQNAAWG